MYFINFVLFCLLLVHVVVLVLVLFLFYFVSLYQLYQLSKLGSLVSVDNALINSNVLSKLLSLSIHVLRRVAVDVAVLVGLLLLE